MSEDPAPARTPSIAEHSEGLRLLARFGSVENAARYVVKVKNVGPEHETIYMGDSEAMRLIALTALLAGEKEEGK